MEVLARLPLEPLLGRAAMLVGTSTEDLNSLGCSVGVPAFRHQAMQMSRFIPALLQLRLGCVLGIPQPTAALLVAAGGRSPFLGSRQEVRN